MSNKLSTKNLRDKFEDILVNLGYTLNENSDGRHIYDFENFKHVILTYPGVVNIKPFGSGSFDGIIVDDIKNYPFFEEIKSFSFVSYKKDKLYIGLASFDRHFDELVKLVKLLAVYLSEGNRKIKMERFLKKIIECRYGNK